MRLDTDEGLRLIENKILEVFCDARTAATLLGRSRADLIGTEALAREGRLSLEDIGLDRLGIAALAVRARRSSAPPEVDAIRIAFTALAESRDRVLEGLDAIANGPAAPSR